MNNFANFFNWMNKFSKRFKKPLVLYWINDVLYQTFSKTTVVFLLNEKVLKNFFLNNFFYWMNEIIVKRFYWTTNFTEPLLSEKTNEIDGKWTNTINLFLIHWSKNEMGHSSNDEQRRWIKSQTRPSLLFR